MFTFDSPKKYNNELPQSHEAAPLNQPPVSLPFLALGVHTTIVIQRTGQHPCYYQPHINYLYKESLSYSLSIVLDFILLSRIYEFPKLEFVVI